MPFYICEALCGLTVTTRVSHMYFVMANLVSEGEVGRVLDEWGRLVLSEPPCFGPAIPSLPPALRRPEGQQ